MVPGPTETPGLMDGLASTGMQDVLVAGMIDQTAVGRLGDPAETAAVALFLASGRQQLHDRRRSLRRRRPRPDLIGSSLMHAIELQHRPERLTGYIGLVDTPEGTQLLRLPAGDAHPFYDRLIG
jgi:hypothetical protein